MKTIYIYALLVLVPFNSFCQDRDPDMYENTLLIDEHLDPNIVTTAEYIQYTAIKEEAAINHEKAVLRYTQIDTLNKIANTVTAKLEAINLQMERATDDERIEALSNLVALIKPEVDMILFMIDSLGQRADDFEAKSDLKQKEAENYLMSLDKNISEQILAYENDLPYPELEDFLEAENHPEPAARSSVKIPEEILTIENAAELCANIPAV
ncbi:MAG: hypothetical protein JKY42_03985, partial [Flavobacteriales bacterium]|nr:hypothetical protein [Flavobacteriales bacterium]